MYIFLVNDLVCLEWSGIQNLKFIRAVCERKSNHCKGLDRL